jgi:hypothetical protein
MLRAVLDDAGVSLADCLEAFTLNMPPEDLMLAEAARVIHSDETFDFDDFPIVSRGDANGAYVMCWAWIDNPETVTTETLSMPLDATV